MKYLPILAFLQLVKSAFIPLPFTGVSLPTFFVVPQLFMVTFLLASQQLEAFVLVLLFLLLLLQ